MPNYCDFEMRVKGRARDVRKLMEWAKAEYHYHAEDRRPASDPEVYIIKDGRKVPTEHHLGYRTFECLCDEESLREIPEDQIVCTCTSGYVAWSCYSCWFEGSHTYFDDVKKEGRSTYAITLPDACRELHLECEFFSSEPGMCFSEHYRISAEGQILMDECTDYQEVIIDGCSSYDELLKAYSKDGMTIPAGLTRECFERAAANGDSYATICSFLDETGEWPFTLQEDEE